MTLKHMKILVSYRQNTGEQKISGMTD